jgi:hypothetical protein
VKIQLPYKKFQEGQNGVLEKQNVNLWFNPQVNHHEMLATSVIHCLLRQPTEAISTICQQSSSKSHQYDNSRHFVE